MEDAGSSKPLTVRRPTSPFGYCISATPGKAMRGEAHTPKGMKKPRADGTWNRCESRCFEHLGANCLITRRKSRGRRCPRPRWKQLVADRGRVSFITFKALFGEGGSLWVLLVVKPNALNRDLSILIRTTYNGHGGASRLQTYNIALIELKISHVNTPLYYSYGQSSPPYGGRHLRSLAIVRRQPSRNPYFWSASNAYSEHVGSNRQASRMLCGATAR